MKTNTIRIPRPPLPALFVCVLLAVLFSACQSAGESPPGSATPKPTRSTAAPSPVHPAATPTAVIPPHLTVDPARLRGQRIEFWHPWTGAAANTLEMLATDFNRSNEWGITVQLMAAGGESALAERMETIFDNGEQAPQVVAAPSVQLFSWQSEHKLLLNLNDYIENPRWGLTTAEIAEFPRRIWEEDTLEGRRYGIPAQRMPQVLFYNRTWAQELGFHNPPATPEEFRTQACAAARANLTDAIRANDGTGGWIVNTSSSSLLSWMAAFGAKDLSELGAGGYNFTNRQVSDMFTFLRKLYDDGCGWVSRDPSPYGYFASRQALFYSGDLADSTNQRIANQRLGSNDQWDALSYPSVNQKPVIITSGLSYAIPAAAAGEQLAAWLFIRWMIQPQQQAALTRATNSFPLTFTAIRLLEDFASDYPQWQQSLMWIPLTQPAPRQPSWRIVRHILEDAARQIFAPTTNPEQLRAVLKQLDRTVIEVLEQRP
ncbi:MAG: extracellular solute-binding protein [Anaerolineaceae bacterium]|nr:extracellular solute-binding protein [Anaerolineaceae bacterium]